MLIQDSFSFILHLTLLLLILIYQSNCDKSPGEGIRTCQRFSLLTYYQHTSKCTCTSAYTTHCDFKMEQKQSKVPVTQSKYFPSGDSSFSSLVKKEESSHQKQEDCPSSQDSDTLRYSLGASYSGYDYDYDIKDFVSDEGSDIDQETEIKSRVDTKRKITANMSDNSSEDDESNSRPWKQDKTTKDKGKYKLRQTTLTFGTKDGEKNPQLSQTKLTRSRLKYNDRDTDQYRQGYPGKKDDVTKEENMLFYKGLIRSFPDGDFIYNIHQNWFGKYKLLERHHGYIQWLFPIREEGMNIHAQALQLHEAKAIQSHPESKARVLTSYRLMLDFYGMKLVHSDTGKIERSDRWKECFENLKWSTHNYLRITRILKSLGELGYEHLKKPFLEFVLHEALVEKTLVRLLRSCEDYWIGTIKKDKDRESLFKFINENRQRK